MRTAARRVLGQPCPLSCTALPSFRFDPELDVFLVPQRRGHNTAWPMGAHETLKHAIEALGVPHTEVGGVRVNGRPATLASRGCTALDHVDVSAAAPAAEPAPRFAADAHLARLARYLRFAGLDTVLHDLGEDAGIATLAQQEQRIVLTRDRALLMHRNIERGCYVRPLDPVAQLAQVARRYGLALAGGSPDGRCLLCNAALQPVTKAEAQPQVPPRTWAAFEQFWRCPACGRTYWRGSHWRRMQAALGRAAALAG